MVSWTNPPVGGSNGVWGTQLNAILDTIKGALNGTVRVTTPEQYHAAGDGVTDDYAALQAAANAGGLVMLDDRKVYAVSQRPLLPSGAVLFGRRFTYPLTGSTGATIKALNSFSADRVVEVAAGAIGAGMVGVNVSGLGNIASALAGVVVPATAYNTIMMGNWIGNLSDTALRVLGGVRHFISDNVLGYDVTGRTLTSRCGVFELNGTDHEVHGNEFSSGPSDGTHPNGYSHVAYPSSIANDIAGNPAYWRTAAWIRGGTHHFSGNVAEFGDLDWFLDGVIKSVFDSDRADYSAGHGWLLRDCVGNKFTPARVFGAGFALLSGDLPVRHGFVVTGASKRNEVDLSHWIGGVAPQPCGYAYADYTSGNDGPDSNVLRTPDIAKNEVIIDTIWRSDPVLSCYSPGEGITRRPPSRHSNGLGWSDATYGDARARGGRWVDDFGDVVGNCCPPRQAEMIPVNEAATTGLAWEPLAGATATATATASYWQTATADGVTVSSQAQKIIAPTVCKVVANAAGHTAGYVELGQASLLTSALTDMTALAAVEAGRAYTIGLELAGEALDGAYTVLLKPRWWSEDGTAFTDGTYAVTGGGTTSTTNKVFAYLQGQTCPANRTRCEVVVKASQAGLPTGRVLWVQHALVALGAHTGWSNP